MVREMEEPQKHERPMTAVDKRSTSVDLSGSENASNNSRPRTAASTKVGTLYHYIPRFNVYGEELPRGKGCGLRPRQRPVNGLSGAEDGEVVMPSHWASSQGQTRATGNQREDQSTPQHQSDILERIDWRQIEARQRTDDMQQILGGQSRKGDLRTRTSVLRSRRRENVQSLEKQRAEICKAREDSAVLWFRTIPIPADRPETVPSGAPRREPREAAWKVGTCPGPARSRYRTRTELLEGRMRERRDPCHGGGRGFKPRHSSYGFGKAPFAEDVFHESEHDFPMTRSKLVASRALEQRRLLEAGRLLNDTQCAGNVKKFLGFDESDVPWWLKGRPKSAPAGSQFAGADGGGDEGMALPISKSQVCLARQKIRELTEKVTRRGAHEVSSGFGERFATLRFTDAVLEMELENQNVVLDEQGKCIKDKPCENDPLYSSFTPDGKFLDPRVRRRMERETKRQKHLIPFSRLCCIGTIKARQDEKMEGRFHGNGAGGSLPVPEVTRTTKRIGLDNRRTTALIAEPNYATLLRSSGAPQIRMRGSQSIVSKPVAVGLEVGVRTGGFAVVEKTLTATTATTTSAIPEEHALSG